MPRLVQGTLSRAELFTGLRNKDKNGPCGRPTWAGVESRISIDEPEMSFNF